MKRGVRSLSQDKLSACLNTFAIISIAGGVLGCSVGWKYSYRGHETTMTQANIDYHKRVRGDVQAKYGILLGTPELKEADTSGSIEAVNGQIPALKKQSETLQEACKVLKAAAVQAPDGGGFTSAGSLLSDDAAEVCKNGSRADEEVAKAEKVVKEKEEKKQKEQQKQEQEEKRRAEEAAARALRAIGEECRAQWLARNDKCDGLPTEEGRTKCQASCTTRGEEGYKDALSSAQRECASAKGAPKCEVTRPPTASIAAEQVNKDLATCAQGCRNDRKEAAEQQARAAREAQSSSSKGGGGAVARACGAIKRRCNDDCKYKPNSLNCYARCMIDARCPL